MADEELSTLLEKGVNSENPSTIEYLANAARNDINRNAILSSGALAGVKFSHAMVPDMVVQLCRLYGNLCYNCSQGRALVAEGDLLEALHTSLVAQHSSTQLHSTHPKLFIVLPAFLQNLIIDNPGKIDDCSALVELLAQDVSQTNQEYQPFEDLLLAIADEGAGDAVKGAGASHLGKTTILAACLQILKASGGEVSDDLLILLIGLTENEKASRTLIDLKLQDILVAHIEADVYSNEKDAETDKSSRELVCELLVLSLGQAELEDLDPDFIGRWIRQDKDSLLVSTGLLVLGNLVTSDHNVDVLVTEELQTLFLNLLNTQDPKMRHSLLGCLRNCCVNVKMCQALVDRGLATEIMKSCTAEAKTLHTSVSILRLMALRSLGVCKEVAENPDFIKRLVSAGSSTSMFSPELGQMNIELARLFSTIITKTLSEVVTRSLVELNCLPFLLSLLSSNHPVLLNQAVLPLCIISTFKPLPDKVAEALSVETFDKLATLLDNMDVQKEIKQNIVKLMNSISNQENEELRDLLINSNIDRSLENFARKIAEDIAEIQSDKDGGDKI